MFRRFVLAVLMVSAPLAAAGGGPVPDFVPPGTRTIIGIHLRTLIDSPLVQSVAADLFKNAGAQWSASMPFTGMDPLKDLDEMVIASTMEGDHPPTLVVCHGRFRVDELTKGAKTYRGVPIKELKSGEGIAVLDAGTLLGGDVKQIRAAIDRREQHAGHLDAVLSQRAEQLSAKYAIWGAGALPADFKPPAGGPEVLKSLDRFDFGVGLNNGLQLAATLHARSAEDIQKLATTMQLIEMMAKAQPDASGTKIETHVQNGSLRVAIDIPEEALKKAIAQQKTALAQAIAGAKGAEPVAGRQTGAAPSRPMAPVSKETKIVSDKEGASVQVTLPGRR
jgi:hypothetical protein